MDRYAWDADLKRWIEQSRNLSADLVEPYLRFFALVFENTSYPDRAWFGILQHGVSLVVGNIYLAAVIRRGKQDDKGIWLLLQDVPNIDGWQSWNTLSTRTAPVPLNWFHSPRFETVVDLLDNPHVWKSYQTASARILEFPTVATDRDDLQKVRNKLRLSAMYPPSNSPLREIDEHRASYANLQDTERQAVIQSRIGQGRFRADLIQHWGCCAVTGCKQLEMLRASHIKPWSHASNQERLDKFNGLLLAPNLDAAFDAGYISFSDDGKIMISPLLAEDDRLRLGIDSALRISDLCERHYYYLQYHRDHRFKGQ